MIVLMEQWKQVAKIKSGAAPPQKQTNHLKKKSSSREGCQIKSNKKKEHKER